MARRCALGFGPKCVVFKECIKNALTYYWADILMADLAIHVLHYVLMAQSRRANASDIVVVFSDCSTPYHFTDQWFDIVEYVISLPEPSQPYHSMPLRRSPSRMRTLSSVLPLTTPLDYIVSWMRSHLMDSQLAYHLPFLSASVRALVFNSSLSALAFPPS